ncbi:MAG: esterase-like activity of phytase family protein [Alphaproteobacteria bacterium]|nr:esterase-like activity of phytase family protein [Alphaproteobacteria bacterium]
MRLTWSVLLLAACGGKDSDTAGGSDDSAADDSGGSIEYVEADLDVSEVETFADALADQIAAGDGAGVDGTFRNSGVLIDEATGSYYAVNGVHPVNQGDYSSYYPKSVVKASMATDTIEHAWSYSEVNGHDVDMEALTFAEDDDYIYVGDEYNYIYELRLSDGEITREWDLADVGISSGIDKGIEAMTYAASSGYFFAGIQGEERIYALELSLDSGETLSEVLHFDLPSNWAPSGLFAHSDGTLYTVSMMGGGQAGEQRIYRYSTEGELLCTLNIPSSLGMTRPDGLYIDSSDSYVYIADSQGPLYGGYSLYKIAWTDPCN